MQATISPQEFLIFYQVKKCHNSEVHSALFLRVTYLENKDSHAYQLCHCRHFATRFLCWQTRSYFIFQAGASR